MYRENEFQNYLHLNFLFFLRQINDSRISKNYEKNTGINFFTLYSKEWAAPLKRPVK